MDEKLIGFIYCLGWLYDISGNYDTTFYITGCCIFISGIMVAPMAIKTKDSCFLTKGTNKAESGGEFIIGKENGYNANELSSNGNVTSVDSALERDTPLLPEFLNGKNGTYDVKISHCSLPSQYNIIP